MRVYCIRNKLIRESMNCGLELNKKTITYKVRGFTVSDAYRKPQQFIDSRSC